MKINHEKVWPFLIGFLLSVNIYLLPFLAASPRATDLGSLLLGVWLLIRLAAGRQRPQPLAAVGLVALTPVIWLFFSLLGNDPPTTVLTARWVLAIPWALVLVLIVEDRQRQESFAWGLVIGGLVNVGVIILQWLGFESLLQMVGLSSSGANYSTFVSHQVRIPGLHGHHNASSSVASLIVPAGFFLYYRGRIKLAHLLGCLFGLLIAIHLTSTRSPLLVSVFTVVFAAALGRKLRQSALIGIVLLGILVPLVVVYGPPGGWARWKNTEALVSNASERGDSGIGGLELCLENPLGLGVTEGHSRLDGRTGIKSTHNAFLQAALFWGLPFGLLVSVGLLLAPLRAFGGSGSPFFLTSLTAFHLCGLFMFEEHLNNPTFIILTAGLMTVTFLVNIRTGKSPADSPADTPR